MDKNIFIDLSKYIDKNYFPPITIYKIDDIFNPIEEELHIDVDFYQIVFYKDEVILVSKKEGKTHFYVSKPYLVKYLGDVTCLDKKNYIDQLLYIIITGRNEPFPSDFISKIIYFLDLPIDNFTLKMAGVNPDLSATTLRSLRVRSVVSRSLRVRSVVPQGVSDYASLLEGSIYLR